MEGFKPIPEYPEYLVSEKGEIYSTISNKYLKPTINGKGYYHFAVREDTNKYKWLQLHRVICRVYGNLPSLDSEMEVDHNDRNKLNILPSNLVARKKKDHYDKTTLERGKTIGGTRCIVCNKRIHSGREYCINCSPVKQTKSPEITAEQIEYWVSKYSWTRAAKELNLSDNGLRKRYTKLTGKSPKEIKKSG
ncbi:HNH endonuclease [Salmonella enterica subsp. enterica serovar Derby]|nr:HNH endonuclease [Salmonella enterica subsp. enterica serovar Derby]EHV4370668.1 HNH endonuclease [Salmonella enterica]